MARFGRGFMVVAVLLFMTGVATAQGVAPEPGDPLVRDVVRMLESGVSAESIQGWLAVCGQHPAAVSADDLIALRRAGAPDALVQQLLDMMPSPPAALTEPAAPAPPAPASPAAPTARPPVPRQGMLPHQAEVTFRIDYRPEAEERTAGWPLFVYLDGELLLWTEGAAHLIAPGSETVEVALEPGRHVVRLLQEQHTYQTIGRSWKHRARVLPEPLVLEVGAGEAWTVDLEHVEQRMPFTGGGSGVVSWTVHRDGDLVDERRNVGPAPYDWPSLCEEVKTALPPEKWDSRRGRRALAGCLGWSELFAGVAGVPTRDEVRAMLEEYRFRPARAD